MKYSAVLFDLDGTLLDSAPALMRIMNGILSEYNFPTHTLEEYHSYIGHGVKALVDQSVPATISSEILEEIYQKKASQYHKSFTDGTSLFPGISEMLTQLEQLNIFMAIYSNKEDEFVKEIVPYYFAQWKFSIIQGRSKDIRPKPDAHGPLSIAKTLGVPAHQCLYVGDTDIDIQTATNAGMQPVWASWGYQKEKPEGENILTINSPKDLISIVEI